MSTGSLGVIDSPASSNAAFPEVDARIHGTLGIGVALSKLKFDLAAEFPAATHEYLVSMIYRPRSARRPGP